MRGVFRAVPADTGNVRATGASGTYEGWNHDQTNWSGQGWGGKLFSMRKHTIVVL
jgi:hypothetical protein